MKKIVFLCALMGGCMVFADAKNSSRTKYVYKPYTKFMSIHPYKSVYFERSKMLREIEILFKSIDLYNPDVVKHLPDTDHFWDYIANNSKPLQRYLEKTKSGFAAKTASDFYLEMNKVWRKDKESENGPPEMTKHLSGLYSKRPIVSVSLIGSNDLNAYVSPYGNIHVTNKLVDTFSEEELIGELAHETAHHKLHHQEYVYYIKAKRQRSNEAISWAMIGVMVGADAYASSSGLQPNTDNTMKISKGLIQWSSDNAVKYKYVYSRECEVQADIVAMRFLQSKGVDPHTYINALAKLLQESENYSKSGVKRSASVYDTHPSLLFRIQCLLCILLAEGSI